MPNALVNVISHVARQTVGKDWPLYAGLLEHWQEIVGQDYARVTTPVKMTFPHQPLEPRRRRGTLYIRLPKGLAMEFSFKGEQIRQRVNVYFGYDAVSKISFEPIHMIAPDIQKHVAEIDPAVIERIKETAKAVDNDDLRAALESFGKCLAKNT